MKIQTQIVTPEWADGEARLEIIADGGKAIYLGPRKAAVFGACAAQLVAFGSTWQPKVVKETATSRSTGRNVGSARLTGTTLANPVIPTPAVSGDLMQQVQAMQAQMAALLAGQQPVSVPVVPATNGKRNGNGKAVPAGTF